MTNAEDACPVARTGPGRTLGYITSSEHADILHILSNYPREDAPPQRIAQRTARECGHMPATLPLSRNREQAPNVPPAVGYMPAISGHRHSGAPLSALFGISCAHGIWQDRLPVAPRLQNKHSFYPEWQPSGHRPRLPCTPSGARPWPTLSSLSSSPGPRPSRPHISIHGPRRPTSS